MNILIRIKYLRFWFTWKVNKTWISWHKLSVFTSNGTYDMMLHYRYATVTDKNFHIICIVSRSDWWMMWFKLNLWLAVITILCSNQTGCKGRVTDSRAFHDTFVTKPHRAIDHGQTDGWDHMAAGEAYHVSLIVPLVCKTRQLPSD